MFKFFVKPIFQSDPRLLDEETANELQTLEVLSHTQEIEELESGLKSHSNEHSLQNAKDGQSLEVNVNKQDDAISSNKNTIHLRNNTQDAESQSQQTLPRPPSENSLQSLSSVSDSKPDVVKCTRHKHLEQDSSSFRNSCDISTELRKEDLKFDGVRPRKRHHSFGDEPESSGSENGLKTSEDFMFGRRVSSFNVPASRENNGIWTIQLDSESTGSGGIWMTEVAPQDIIDERRDGWRLSLDHFTSKRQGSKRKAKHVSRRMRSYYKSQDKLIKSFESIRYEMDEDKIDINKLRRKVSAYAKITFFANLVLLVIKIIAVIMSGSVSLISSLVDSAVDLISGVVIWVTTRLVKKTDRYRYPQGRAKLEPIAIVILSVIMAVASLHLVEETIEKIVHLASGDSEPPNMEWLIIGISSITVVVKLVLFLICRKVPHHTIQALAQDHRNDVISNTAAIIFGYIGSKEMQAQINNSAPGLIFLDPAGAILICIYISISWSYTGWGQIKMLTGHTATPDFLSKITWLSLDHHEQIKKINSVRAFHFGNYFLVEVTIILPENMTVQEARDITEPLEQKLERLTEVERAFVHIDYKTEAQKKRNKIV